MRTIEIVVDEMPETCFNCEYCIKLEFQWACILLQSVPIYYKRRDDCPLIAWQSAESAPRDGGVFMVKSCIGIAFARFYDGGFCDMDREPLPDGFLWRPLPKTPEA